MHTRNQQTILGRLYTNAAFRKEFISDKKSFYQKYNVPLDTIQFIEEVSVSQLTFFAESLLKKRVHEVKNLLPLTFKLMGKNAQTLFFEFSDNSIPMGNHKHHEDALEFIAYLLKQKDFSTRKTWNRYVKSVLMYEKQQILNFISQKKYQIRFYKYDVAGNYLLLLKQNQPEELPKKFSVVMWRKGKVVRIR